MQENSNLKKKTTVKKRIPQNNKKVKKKAKKGVKKCLVLIFIILAIIIFAMITPIFNITQIEVSGNQKVDTESIINLSELHIGDNIFRNLKSKVVNNVKEHPYIGKIKMKRVLPSTIELIVEERTIEYQIKLIDGYIYIDNQGYILENSQKRENVPVIQGLTTTQEQLLNEKRLNVEDLNKLNTIMKIIAAAKSIKIENLITAINAENTNEYILYLKNDKKYVYIGDESNLNNKMLYIQTILEKEKKHSGKIYVNGNLSEGFKPYFREEKISYKE